MDGLESARGARRRMTVEIFIVPRETKRNETNDLSRLERTVDRQGDIKGLYADILK
jgi:hypothetical protein